MSPFEQRIEPPNKDFQYILFACEPYETVGFKIPNERICREAEKFVTTWHNNVFTAKFSFEVKEEEVGEVTE